ncbi:MAG: phosphatase PAP2 family protein [Myxococcota bacterium]
MAFHTFMLFRSFFAPPGEDRSYALAFGFVLWSITLSAIITVRGELFAPGRRRALYYRLAVFAPVVISYFQMMFLLPGLQPTLVDWELYAIDRVIFGETPAVLLEAFNRRPVVEWIAFFYYSYFYMMAAMLIPTLLFDRGQRLRELMVGGVLVATLGHTLYTFVPGAGPWKTLEFTAALDGGFFWGLVQETVSSAGAQLDIFPSLHTAYPTLFSLHAFGNRDRAPFKFLWPVIAFFAANMIVATMFLRWHWAIDVVAGLALAITARTVAVYVARREGKRGQGDDDRQPVWEPLWRIEPDQPRP